MISFESLKWNFPIVIARKVQENIDFVCQTLQADPMMTARCNNMPNRPIISPSLFNRNTKLNHTLDPSIMHAA